MKDKPTIVAGDHLLQTKFSIGDSAFLLIRPEVYLNRKLRIPAFPCTVLEVKATLICNKIGTKAQVAYLIRTEDGQAATLYEDDLFKTEFEALRKAPGIAKERQQSHLKRLNSPKRESQDMMSKKLQFNFRHEADSKE